jgi:hypothetical protein
MLYLAPDTSRLRRAPLELGAMLNFRRGSISPALAQGRPWALDNGCFSRLFDEAAFFNFLEKLELYQAKSLFIVAPDKVGDNQETLELWERWRDQFRATGYPIAFVAQDGQEISDLPKTDVLFIGF